MTDRTTTTYHLQGLADELVRCHERRDAIRAELRELDHEIARLERHLHLEEPRGDGVVR